MTPSEYKAMWKRDLARAGLKQKDVVEQMRMRHTQVTPSAISQWSTQGYPPRGRVEMLAEILGPDSEFARVPMATWESMWAKEDANAEPAPAPKPMFSRQSETQLAPPKPWVNKEVAPEAVANALKGLAMPERYKPLVHRVREAASPDLASSFRPPIEDRPRRHIPAYQHNGLVVEFANLRNHPSTRQHITVGLFKLAVLKARYGHEGIRSHMLIAVEEPEDVRVTALHGTITTVRPMTEEQRDAMLEELWEDAHELGIGLGVAESPAHAASYLNEIAFGSINEEIDDTGVEEIDPDMEI